MKTAFLFPGQGAQYPQMATDLYQASPEVKKLFDLASETTRIDTLRLLSEGTEEELKETVNTQVSVTLANLAASIVVRSKGFQPDAVAGFSLGEYAALVEAGVLTVEQVFPLVKLRGELMASAAAELDRSQGDPGMAAVLGLSPEIVEEVLAREKIKDLYGANFNSPVQVVVSGTAQALAACEEPFKSAGAKRIIVLKVSGPFHSPLLKKASEELSKALASVEFKNPTLPIFSNVTGKRVTSGSELKALAAKQVVEPVRWTTEEAGLIELGCQRFLEVGPGSVLGGLLKAFTPDFKVLPAGKLEQILEIV